MRELAARLSLQELPSQGTISRQHCHLVSLIICSQLCLIAVSPKKSERAQGLLHPEA